MWALFSSRPSSCSAPKQSSDQPGKLNGKNPLTSWKFQFQVLGLALIGKAWVGAHHYGTGGCIPMPPLRGQTLHKPHGLKLKAGQLPKRNGLGVGKGVGWGSATQKKKGHACPAGKSNSCLLFQHSWSSNSSKPSLNHLSQVANF